MKNNNLIIIFICFIIFQAVAVGATGSSSNSLPQSSVVPVEWQSLKLQEMIEDKVKRSLVPLIDPNSYVIEVRIGIDLEDLEDPSTKKITKINQKPKIQFSTEEAPENGDDFVVFNKIGLEAPIVGDEGIEIINSEVELAQKAMIEMNDRYNLFNYLKTIEINLTFDKGLSKNTKESIQKIVKGLSFNTNEIIPQINIQYIDLKSEKEIQLKNSKAASAAAEAAAKKAESKENYFKNLDIMIGLIASALLIALAMIFISMKGSKVEENGNNSSENKNEDNVDAENNGETTPTEGDDSQNDIEEGDDMIIDLTKTDPATLKINEGLERFRKIHTNHYNDMSLMIKEWIKIKKTEETNALRALVQVLTDDELTSIFKCLNIDERASWKMCLGQDLNKDELSKAFHFIGSQVIQTMMVPSLIDDYEICDLLLGLRAEDAVMFTNKNQELGVIFANVLSAKTIGEMFKLLDYSVSSRIIEESTFFRKEVILEKMPILKQAMLEFKAKRDKPPFIKRIVEILPTAQVELEKKLYSTLIQHLSMSEIVNIACSNYPRSLLSELPSKLYKSVIEVMPLEEQLQFFAIKSEEDREIILDNFATKGSKNREMIDLELAAVLKNEILVKRLRSEKAEQIESDFLIKVREVISKSTEDQKEVYGKVEQWLKELDEEQVEENLRIA